jgi:hypothetical protein
MRYLFIALLLFSPAILFCQANNQIGQVRLLKAIIIKTDTVREYVSGVTTTALRFTIIARSRVQLSCNYGDPSTNDYDTVTNRVYISYGYDPTGSIKSAVYGDIERYVNDQEAWAKQYNSGPDFTYLAFNKSFFVNGDQIIPFIWSGAERSGDYQIFYFESQFYKIELAEGHGFGSLSEFVDQNMYFIEDGRRMNLGEYIKNVDIAKQIIARGK